MKARLVARGSQIQEEKNINMYVPVARMSTVRILLGEAARKNWQIKQQDIPQHSSTVT